jgi:hypothetical protein
MATIFVGVFGDGASPIRQGMFRRKSKSNHCPQPTPAIAVHNPKLTSSRYFMA